MSSPAEYVPLDFDSYSRGLNAWRDKAAAFRSKFSDHSEFYAVASKITDLLTDGLAHPYNTPQHSFTRYADEEHDWSVLMERLRQDVRNNLPTSRLRGYTSAFFAVGGVHRQAFEELFEDFDDFAWTATLTPEEAELDQQPDNELPDLEIVDDDESDDGSDSVIDLTNPGTWGAITAM